MSNAFTAAGSIRKNADATRCYIEKKSSTQIRTPSRWSCVITPIVLPFHFLQNTRHKRRCKTLIQESLPIKSGVKTLTRDTLGSAEPTSKSASGVPHQQSLDQLFKLRAKMGWIRWDGHLPFQNPTCSPRRTLIIRCKGGACGRRNLAMLLGKL